MAPAQHVCITSTDEANLDYNHPCAVGHTYGIFEWSHDWVEYQLDAKEQLNSVTNE